MPEPPFTSSLAFLVSSAETRARLERALEALSRAEPIAGTTGALEFAAAFVSTESELLQKLKDLPSGSPRSCAIVVSDQLTLAASPAGHAPSALTKSIRAMFRESQNLCGMVAIVSGEERRTPDIDSVVSARDLDVGRLRRAITNAAMGLWMKSPPGFRPSDRSTADAVRVRAVQSADELEKALKLRYRIYELMGYMPEDVCKSGAGLELDSFDINSLHFIATDARTEAVVGTARLVLVDVPPFKHDSVVGTPSKTLAAQRGWCRDIAAGIADRAFRERLEHPYFAPLPILQSSDFRDRWGSVLSDVGDAGEVSRVVVAPEYRGVGASRLLVRATIATAVDLAKAFLLLECVPTHAGMYAQYGFQLLEGHHCRAQELDQVAVGMRLDLRDPPGNATVALARRDVAMMMRTLRPKQPAASGFLCLCHHAQCWRDGGYELRGTADCPLRAELQAPVDKTSDSKGVI